MVLPDSGAGAAEPVQAADPDLDAEPDWDAEPVRVRAAWVASTLSCATRTAAPEAGSATITRIGASSSPP